MSKENFKTSIGGQAIIEGIVMKGPEKTCIAVRQPDGEIHIETTKTRKNPFRKIPILRGAAAMIISLIEGYKNITKAAEYAYPEGEDEDKFDEFLKDKFGDKAGTTMGIVSAVLGSLLSIALFIVLPTIVTGGLAKLFVMSNGLKSLCEGVLKIVIFIAYLFFVTRIKDIHRVFEYHGAEHKSIACYEHGEELTVENVKRFSRFHPRCSTSFLFIVIIISIIVFSFVPVWDNVLLRVGLKLLALPLIMGIAFEILKFSGSHDNFFCKALAFPGLLVQRLTAFEPDDGQMEVAIASLKQVLPDKAEQAKW